MRVDTLFFMPYSVTSDQNFLMTAGLVYAFKNPSHFLNGTQLIKIGYAKDIEKRKTDLYKTGVPMKFEEICVKEVSNMEEVEKNLHSILIDYRVNEGREFFNCSEEMILCLFKLIDGKDVMNYSQNENEEEQKNDCPGKSRPKFKFSDAGIENGNILKYTKNPLFTVQVCDAVKSKVIFEGEYNMSLSKVAGIIKKREDNAIGPFCGRNYFDWNGKSLEQVYEETYPKPIDVTNFN